MVPGGGVSELPNGGREGGPVNFMSLKSSQVTNQTQLTRRTPGFGPNLVTAAKNQGIQVTNLDVLTNERTSSQGAILLLLHLGLLATCPHFSQYFDEALMGNTNLRSPGPPAPLPAVFCPPGVPFGPVHFTNYPLKSEYKDYTPEKILKLDPFPTYNLLGKFNYLPAYNLPMEPPVTPKPIPASSPNLPTNHSGKLFGIVYIILTGVIDTIILAASLWSWVGKSTSYLFKLVPLLWWALPAKTLAGSPWKQMGWLPNTGSLIKTLKSKTKTLVQYGARAPDNLPPGEADLQLGGVKKAGLTRQQGSE
ncbi:hypothetical protein DSO57_1030455 [Entomophthora muscae]|uniref:Uncharacterized protein n=1 Tax=Entomophthora muscae TaxID=34485 RepID=A0ACC2RFJ5_9FUNG|nr:hypothetical protein DSO57_1030455 [Entomophthora muscae]